ncbi:MAG: hypothetical protein K6F54_09590, partial [Lachnospiraceae bacterium]|nr:hypothetical protein [Lachnospiraceae bacterium]
TFTIQPRSISDSNVSDEHASFNSHDDPFPDTTVWLSYNSEQLSAQNGSLSVEIPSVVTAGAPAQVVLTGQGNYTGTRTVTTSNNVPDVQVEYDDSTTKKSMYSETVKIDATGYKVSMSENGPWNDSLNYSVTGDYQNVTFYFKNNASGLIIQQNVTGLTIKDQFNTKYDGSTTKQASYQDQVTITADGYMIGTSESGPFNSSYVHSTPGENQSFYLYFLNNSNPSGTPVRKLISGITIVKSEEAGIPIKYDSSATKKSSYTDKVTISADNYLVGTSMDGPFSSGYDHTKTGKDQSFYLYFVDKNDTSATPVRKLITGITVVSGTSEADEGAPTGSITVDTYKSDKIAQYKDVVYITKDKKEIDIKAVDDDGSPVTIEYFTSENFYVTRSEIEGAVTDKKAKWKTYYSEGKPTLTENTAEYIYARVSDASGNTRYLSTGKVIYDTKAPTVNTIALADEKGETVAVMTGKDNLSGIWRFYLKYEEKNKGNKTPTAAEVIAENKYIEELTTDDLSSAGRLKVLGIDPDKEYRFYGVAIDKAGNIGEVLVYDAKGKANADNSVSKNSISDQQGSAGNGAAASNGIAGSGGTKPTPSSATSNWANLPESTTQTNPLDREINRTPYISEATEGTKTGLLETGGWDKIENEVTNAQSGTRLSVEMSGLSVIPGSMISKLQNKDVSVTIKMADGIEWVIAGTDVDRAIGSDIDLRVIKDSKTIPYELLSAIIDAYPHTEIDIAHDGEFGFTATLRVPFGVSSAGMYGNLYYYDEAAGELKLLQSSLIGNDGYAAFRMSHASDYSIVVKSVDMLAASDEPPVTAVSTIDETTVDISDAKAELSLLPQSGRSILGMRIWLFVMALICAAMCLTILFIPSFQREKVYN